MTIGEPDVTPQVLLQHMQQMQAVLVQRIDGAVGELRGEIRRLDRKLDTLTAGVDAIDARLDAIEIEGLPHRVRALEMER